MIEAVTTYDVPSISSEIGEMFFSECELPGGFNGDVFRENWMKLISNNIGVMWTLRIEKSIVGALGAVLLPDVNNAELVASEMFWYVHSSHRKSMWGLRLFTTFEAWAKQIGAKRIVMAHLTNPEGDQLKKIYLHRGYKPVETHYSKTL